MTIHEHSSVYVNAHRRFIEMGAIFMDDEAVFMFLEGLPKTVEWKLFKRLTMQTLSLQVVTSSPSTSALTLYPLLPKPSTFDQVAKLFTNEANSMIGSAKLAGPGSEYVNAAISQTPSGNKTVVTNPAMGIRIHKYNAKGEKCTNKVCADLPRAGNHDVEHCYYPGGGMEGQGPSWSRGRSPKTKEVSAASAKMWTASLSNIVNIVAIAQLQSPPLHSSSPPLHRLS
ncbi:hypothetical protein PAXINDRAFT_14864 [Paxillus involutus ATCC 200175]|uniref:Uncharacterized protein n=1 Tax=Paxillus involutus ATCC 200175 TaxID=664439 RepID=A0A0C9T9E0_PAXIN|nr:hypothetical protein PAXINDRAFT_14864 [Paxillus involutus ATCC 200175]